MNTSKIVWALFAIGISAAHCSSSDTSLPSTPSTDGSVVPEGDATSDTDANVASDAAVAPDVNTNVTPDVACTSFASAICARTSACTPFALGALYGDEATCKDREKKGCLATLGAPNTGATPSSTQICANALPSVSCTDFGSGSFGPSCQIQPGTIQNGGACGDSAQCVSTFCAIAATSNCGVCAPVSKKGDACVNGSCSVGLTCDASSTKCVPPGTGQPQDACTDQSQCDLAHAVGCNTSSMKCIALTIANGNCGANSVNPTSFAVCSASGTCSAVILGKCSAAASDGSSCNAKNGPSCLPPARCVGNSCTLPTPSTCK